MLRRFCKESSGGCHGRLVRPCRIVVRPVESRLGRSLGLAAVIGAGLIVCARVPLSAGIQSSRSDASAPTAGSDARKAETSSETAMQSLQREEMAAVEKLRKDFPGSAGPSVLLGMVHHFRGDLAAAEACWRAVLKRHPRQVEAYDGLSHNAMDKGDHQQAAALARKALQFDRV